MTEQWRIKEYQGTSQVYGGVLCQTTTYVLYDGDEKVGAVKDAATGVRISAALNAVAEQAAEIARLRSEHEAAIREVERSTQRWTALTSTRQADTAEHERLVTAIGAALAAYDDWLHCRRTAAVAHIIAPLTDALEGCPKE